METLPLDHIRLLYLEAGLDKAPICCKLVSTSLQASPPYEALSYTWGSLELSSTITCNGLPLHITQHLFEALQYLRQPEQERIMWIDAVCINQKNDKERAEQVCIMKDIYVKAFHVVIWLGNETPEDKAAFSMLDRFKAVFEKYDWCDIGGENWEAVGLPRENEPDDWIALVMLFRRPWFQRIWVIQEAVMAREATVCCGPYSVPWDLIAQLAVCTRKNGMLGPFPIDTLAPGLYSVMIIRHLKMAPGYLLAELRLTRRFLASEPRDKIFALMGVVKQKDNIGVEVDYKLSTEEVYLAVAIHNLENLKNLELLANATLHSAPSFPNLPSWVPDWSYIDDHRSIIAGVTSVSKMCAGGQSPPILSISADKKILTIRGAVFDTVSQIKTSNLFEEGFYDLDPDGQRRQNKWNRRSKTYIENYIAFAEAAQELPEGQSREEALWRTMCCDMAVEIPARRAPAEFAIGYKTLRMLHEITTADGVMDMAEFNLRFVWEHYHHYLGLMISAAKYLRGRHLCVTTGGYIGCVPYGTMIGDRVCILFGATVPFLLREWSQGQFKLVGECYIHGIMDGEALKERDLEASSRDFEIV